MIKFVAASAVAFVVWFFALGFLVLVLNTIGGAVAMGLLGLEGETIGDMPEALRTVFALFALAGATLLAAKTFRAIRPSQKAQSQAFPNADSDQEKCRTSAIMGHTQW